jgi:hypothetical protein
LLQKYDPVARNNPPGALGQIRRRLQQLFQLQIQLFALFRKPAVAPELLQQRRGALVKAELLFELVDPLAPAAPYNRGRKP